MFAKKVSKSQAILAFDLRIPVESKLQCSSELPTLSGSPRKAHRLDIS
jgi:hypothetical protein